MPMPLCSPRWIPGQCCDDACVFRAAGGKPQADLAGNRIRPRRRHPHGDGGRCVCFRRMGRHAYRTGRSAQPAFRAGGAGLSLRDRGRSERAPLLRRRQRTGARLLRSSTAGCSRSKVSSARSAPRCRRINRRRSRALRRRPGFPQALCARRSRPSTLPLRATPPGAEVPWREFPNHFGGALSKPLVMPETAGARHLDYRISMYQPMAHVARHQHRVQEQIYHVLEGEGLMEIAGQEPCRAQARCHLPAARGRARDFQFRPGRPGVPGHHLAGQRRSGLVKQMRLEP